MKFLFSFKFNIIIKQQRMSFIIDNAKIKYFYNFDKKQRVRKVNNSASSFEINCREIDREAKTFEIALNQQKISYNRHLISHNNIKITFEEVIHLPELYGLLSLTFYKVSNSVSININLLNSQQQYLKIAKQEDRLSLNKKILLVGHGPVGFNIKSNINLNTGHINFSMPFYNLFQKRQRLDQFWRPKFIKVNQIYNSIAIQFTKYIQYINIFEETRAPKKEILADVFKCFQMINLYKKQKYLEKDQHYNIRQQKNKQNQTIKALLNNKILCPNHIQSSLTLFSKSQFLFDEIKDKYDCQFDKKKQVSLTKHIGIRQRAERLFRTPNQVDDCMLVSSILIKDPMNVNLRNINKGGFSSILEGQMTFWMTKDEETNANLKNIVQKTPPMKMIVVVKKQQVKSGKILGKNKHEKNIISILKHSKSSYLNRYFNPINKENTFTNDILMQKIAPLNLNQYICLRKQSISLHSKLMLLFNIVQGLRSLYQYKVVHMDLKPANIIINNLLDLKLIDFGQSYYPKVHQKGNYKPGYTIPYSCPEIKQNVKSFTEKSDIFSFGVIMNEILHKKSPFYFYDDKHLVKLSTKQYLNSWFYASQSQHEHQPLINNLLDQLISRCLDSDIQKRPDLSMMAIFLHECLQVMS